MINNTNSSVSNEWLTDEQVAAIRQALDDAVLTHTGSSMDEMLINVRIQERSE